MRHNAALFNLHRLSLHTPLLSHARAHVAIRKACCTHHARLHTQHARVSQCDRHSGAALARSARGVRLATPRILPFGAPSPPASPRHRGRGACRARVTASVLRPHLGLLLDGRDERAVRRALGALLHDAQRGLDAGVPVRMVAQVALHLGARLAAACRHTRNLARDEGEERHEVGLDVVGLAYAGTGRRTLSGRTTAGIAARAWRPEEAMKSLP